MTRDSPQIPSSFDPAIHLHSEPDALPPSTNYSDDIEAALLQIEETRITKNQQGVVIQHRAWGLAEAFRSEEYYPIDTPIKERLKRNISDTSAAFPSSPPRPPMPFISSPVAYPPSSSPYGGADTTPRKRRKIAEDGKQPRSPLNDVDTNRSRTVAGFLVDDEEDEEESAEFKARLGKRKAFTSLAKPSSPSQIQLEDGDDIVLPEVDQTTSQAKSREETHEVAIPSLPQKNQAKLNLATAVTGSGRTISIAERRSKPSISYQQLVASRSAYEAGDARKCYYGINIHQLIDDAAQEEADKIEAEKLRENEAPIQTTETNLGPAYKKTLMWTEKYRAKKFTDLVGDERTHRSVLRWLKNWDPIVFPGLSHPKPKARANAGFDNEEHKMRKILLLTGPPGLGKTTLAHVCARQAGYEAQEINASDERSKDIVKGRIRDMVGTENVRGVDTKTVEGNVRKAGRPVCVIVDEVDGVVSGSGGGGEGGFIKALIDLIHLDQRNSNAVGSQTTSTNRKKKGDKFKLLRPIILICNDLYHPSLRPLRQSSIAEIVHIRKPPLNMVVSRMHSVFQKEGIPADTDGVRRLCEATWGVSNRKEGGTGTGTGEGDIRGIMVVGEWVSAKLRSSPEFAKGDARLTRRWVEEQILGDLGPGGGAARSLGRGGAREVVERIFKENAGFPKTELPTAKVDPFAPKRDGPIGVAEGHKGRAMGRLREMIDTSGDADKIVQDCFSTYPTYSYQDDTFLTKPNTAYDWLQFHDTLSSAVHGSQEWELAPYLSQTPLAFHHLFATSNRSAQTNQRGANESEDTEPTPFCGPSAPFTAAEAHKHNKASLTALQSALSLPLSRMFRSPAHLSTDLLPYMLRLLAPAVKPVIITTTASSGPSSSSSKFSNTSTASIRRAPEKLLVARAVTAMLATGVRFERARVDYSDALATANRPGGNNGGWVFRMEPPLDALAEFPTLDGSGGGVVQVRFAVRQVLDAEYRRESARRDAEGRRRRGGVVEGEGGGAEEEEAVAVEELAEKAVAEKAVAEKAVAVAVKRDFFGRVVVEKPVQQAVGSVRLVKKGNGKEEGRVWVSFNEGFSNAVRKPITLKELMGGL